MTIRSKLRFGSGRTQKARRWRPDVEPLETRRLLSLTINEYSKGITSASQPDQITVDSSGNLWFTESNASKIAVINSSSHSVSQYGTPTGSSTPIGIALGSDNNIWFTENTADKIGMLKASNDAITEYTLPTANAYPSAITAGPDDDLWFTEVGANKIGMITTAGVITEYPIPSPTSNPSGITEGSDGNLWFTESGTGKIGRITPTGTVTEYSLSSSSSDPTGITTGPDGNVWFTETNANKIGMITPSGVITEYPIPTGDSGPSGITSGPDGNLWFTEANANKIGTISTSGAISENAVPTISAGPAGIVAGAGASLWFTESAIDQIGEVVLPSVTATGLTVSPTGSASYGQSITFTATVTPTTPTIPTGSVTFTVDGTVEPSVPLAVLVGQDQATFSISSLTPGAHTVTASYSGDSTFAGSTSSVIGVSVNRAASTSVLSASVSPASFGQAVTFTDVVSPTYSGVPTGTVTFSVDGKAQTPVALSDVGGQAEATFTTSSLVVSGHSISASYSGDTTNAPSTAASLNESVVPGTSTTQLSSSPVPAVFGQPVTFTAVVTSAGGTPTGSVVFTIDGQAQAPVPLAVVNGTNKASLTVASLSSGNHTVTAAYGGSTSFGSSTSSPLTTSNSQGSTAIALSSSSEVAILGQAVTFSALVTSPSGGTPTGAVTFSIDGVAQTPVALASVFGQDEATFTTASLSSGTHTITASYSGDTSYAGSSASGLADGQTQTVNTDPTAIALGVSPSLAFAGYAATFTANVSSLLGAGTPTGTVTFSIDGQPQTPVNVVTGTGQSIASFVDPGLSAGTHTITAVYNGDATFSTSISSLSDVVAIDPTATTLTESLNPSNLGQSVTFTAVVAQAGTQLGQLGNPSGVPTGTITFSIDGQAQSPVAITTVGGQQVATFTTSSLSSGDHTITSTYNGNLEFSTSGSNTLQESVGSISTSLSMAASSNPATVGVPVTVVATINPVNAAGGTVDNLTGAVTFSVDGVAQTPVAALRNASGPANQFSASLNLSNLTVGPHTITAFYPGDGTFGSSTSTFNLTITSATTTTQLVASPNPSNAGQAVTFTAIVTPLPSGTPTGSVTFTIDGQSQTPVALAVVGGHDEAIFTTSTLGAGAHVITASYGGDGTFTGSASSPLTQTVSATTTTLTAAPNPASSGQSVTFTAVVAAMGGAMPTGAVTFRIDGVAQTPVTLAVVNGRDQATFATSTLSPGTHAITAAYAGSGAYAASISASISESIVQTATTVQLSATPFPGRFGAPVTFTAVVTASSGNSPAGLITFSIDGVAQPPVALAVVGGRDQATFTTSTLATGNHTITASYGGGTGFAAGTSSAVSVPVYQSTATVQVSPSLTPAAWGQAETLTAVVRGVAVGTAVPTGVVTFKDGAKTLGTVALVNGTASLALIDPSIGSHSLTAVYSGDTGFTGATSSVASLTVNTEPVDSFDGSGKSNLSVYRPATDQFLIRTASGGTEIVQFGDPSQGDIPVPGDYDGVGHAELAVFRPSTDQWLIQGPSGLEIRQFGDPTQGDLPVPGDYDGSGKTDLAVFRPSTDQWLILYSNGTKLFTQFGDPTHGDIPVPGDYDGVGHDQLALFRPSTDQWLIQGSSGLEIRQFGDPSNGDVAAPGDYDGNGVMELAVFRPSTAQWLIQSPTGLTIVQFGDPANGDIPLEAPFQIKLSLTTRFVKS